MNFNLNKATGSSALVLLALIFLAAFFAGFKALLTTLFSHHWVGKFIITTLVFLVVGFFSRATKKETDQFAWKTTLWVLAIIFAFYLIEYALA